MGASLALLPIFVLLLCMIALRWTASSSGILGAATAICVALLAFGYGTGGMDIAGPLLEAVFTSATILWIVFPALAIHEVQTRSGASACIGRWLATISDKPVVLVLILAWFFALLLEGAAGFGTPVALIAPMLVGLGFSPQRSLILALVGHAAGVSFGAVGIPMVPLLEAQAVDPRKLSLVIMLLHAALSWALVLVVFRLAAPEDPAGSWILVPLAAVSYLLPALGLAWLVGPELPTLGGALIGGVIFVALVKWKWPTGSSPPAATRDSVFAAILPYALVLLGIVASRTLPPLSASLQSVVVEWNLAARFSGSVSPLYHPGTMLMLALAGAVMLRPASRLVILPSLRAAALRLPSVALALVSVLLLSRIMIHSGMIDALASAAAAVLGSAWPAAVPLVGALGSFITGSATASNILFGRFQIAAADASGLEPMLALAGQGFGAAIGNVISPHNIVAGAATVGLVGREGTVLKATLPVCLTYASLGGLLLLAAAASW